MNREEPERGGNDVSSGEIAATRQIPRAALTVVAIGAVVLTGAGSLSWAEYFAHPEGILAVGAGLSLPTFCGVLFTTVLAIAFLAGTIRLLLWGLPEGRQPYLGTLSFFLSSGITLALVSVAALIWAKDAGSIVRVTGNFAGLSALAILIFARIRSTELTG